VSPLLNPAAITRSALCPLKGGAITLRLGSRLGSIQMQVHHFYYTFWTPKEGSSYVLAGARQAIKITIQESNFYLALHFFSNKNTIGFTRIHRQ